MHVVELLRERGHQAYLVGGVVRDRLLGRPSKDSDVATSARPEEVQEIFPDARRVGARFGVCAVKVDGDWVEVATFRSDGVYRDGRRPDSVAFTTEPREDVERRDFTMNGILYDPVADEHLDFVGGREDIRRKLVRAIGDPLRRFGEDRLRMLRAVRFASTLGFEIEPRTLEAIRSLASGIADVAPERVRDELGRILTEPGARRGFELLESSGLLQVLLPEIAALRGVEQPPQYHPEGDVWNHTMKMLDLLDQPSFALAWGALLHDVGKPATFRRTDRIRFHGHVERGVAIARDICGRLRFSKADTQAVVALVKNHMKFLDVQRMRPSTVRRFVSLPQFESLLALHEMDCLAGSGDLENHAFATACFREFLAEGPDAPLLAANDLKQAGYEPGPVFGEILARVEELRLDGALKDRKSALEWAEAEYPPASAGRAADAGL